VYQTFSIYCSNEKKGEKKKGEVESALQGENKMKGTGNFLVA
jgi:hypothetical protein